MLSPELEHQINQIAEARLDRAWEDYNEEGPTDEEDYDPWTEGDMMYDYYRDQEAMHGE